jgi:anti-sigma28 factor (negative regulator of flagellin synthesis)
MKVNDQKAGQLVPLAAQKVGGGDKAVAAGPKEKVSVSKAEAVDVPQARAMAATARTQRVQEIISAVKRGQYYPSPQQIANQLVAEAEIEARLRSILK